jgi:hypothetical protein
MTSRAAMNQKNLEEKDVLAKTRRNNGIRGMVSLGLAVALAMFALLLAGCGGDPSSLSYLSSEIEIAGVEDAEFSVTVESLTQLDTVSKRAEGARSNGDIVKITAVGPTLDTFLAQYGKKQTDFTTVRFVAEDGYSIAVPQEILEKREIVLAYMDGNTAFDRGQSAPLRAVVIGERAMYWARMVCRIEFETGASATQTDRVVFVDSALPELGAEKGSYSEEEGGDIVSTIDLLSKYGGLSEGGKVYMSASDGLKKNETIENFLKGYLKYSGEHVPQFCSPELPEGMNMNDIVSIRTGTTAYVSLARAAEVYEAKENESGAQGLGFSDLVKDLGFGRAQSYQLTDDQGQTWIFTEHGLVAGVFAQDGDGLWTFYSETSDGKDAKNVAGVVMVEAVVEEQAE